MDPLLSDLSPNKTLEALNTYLAIGKTGKEPSGALHASIARASPSERAFGIKAALASKKLREWCTELAGWQWPDTQPPADSSKGFQPPSKDDLAGERKVEAISYDSGVVDDKTPEAKRDANRRAGGSGKEEYWGFLPAQLVLNHEQRLDEIDVEMEYLEVEELKIQVLGKHIVQFFGLSSY
jgi:hypothetical protein